MSELWNENEVAVEVDPQTAEAIAQLKEELEVVKAEEARLLAKIAECKELGLLIQTEQLRELLRRCLATKARLHRTLMDIEVTARTAEMELIADEVEEVLASESVEAALTVEEDEKPANLRKLRKEALGYRIASRLIGYVGVLACLIGSLVYLVLTQVETMNLPFEPLYLAVAGGAAVFFLLVAVLIGAKAKDLAGKVADIEEERLLRLIEKSEACELAQIEAESVGAAAVAESESVAAAEKAAAAAKRKDPKVVAKALAAKAKKNPKKTAGIAAATAAGIALAAVVAAKSGSKKPEGGKTMTIKFD